MDHVCSITSFPKSGNTWMRSVLSALFDARPVERFFPDIYGDRLFQAAVSAPSGQFFFIKSHAADFDLLQKRCGRPFSHNVYLVRHPLDVFCSQLNYVSDNVTGASKTYFDVPCDSAEAILERGHIGYFLSSFMIYGTLQPWFREAGSWFRAAEYWIQRAQRQRDVTVIRYEEMIQNPSKALAPLSFLFDLPIESILIALAQSEKTTTADGRFFWKKSVGTYKAYISEAQIEGFRAAHGERCASLGYPI